MKTLERNDVDISKLFQWKKEYKISFMDRNIKLWIRLAGDADISRARVFALRKSSELRKKLHDPESDEYIAFIQDREFFDKDSLVLGCLTFYIRTATDEVYKELRLPIPVEPDSDATLEEQEEYQKQIDEWPNKRDEEVNKLVSKKLDDQQQVYEVMDESELYDLYIKLFINQTCEMEMLNRFREMCAYLSCYNDEKCTIKFFDNFDEFDNLDVDIKKQIIENYTSLEIESEVLKKSLAARQ